MPYIELEISINDQIQSAALIQTNCTAANMIAVDKDSISQT